VYSSDDRRCLVVAFYRNSRSKVFSRSKLLILRVVFPGARGRLHTVPTKCRYCLPHPVTFCRSVDRKAENGTGTTVPDRLLQPPTESLLEFYYKSICTERSSSKGLPADPICLLCRHVLIQPRRPVSRPLPGWSRIRQQWIESEEAMGGGAGPLVVFTPADQSGPNWISLNVVDCASEMVRVQDRRVEAVSPEMTGGPMGLVEVPGVIAMGLSDHCSQGLFVFENRHQMDVIRHQSVRPDAYLIPFGVFTEQSHIDRPVRFLEKSRQFSVSTMGNVMGKLGHNDARSSRHGNIVSGKREGTVILETSAPDNQEHSRRWSEKT
jgi:hypothetical protein